MIDDIYSDLYYDYSLYSQTNGTCLFFYISQSDKTRSKLKNIVSFDDVLTHYIIEEIEYNNDYYLKLISQNDYDMVPYCLYKGGYLNNNKEVLVSRMFTDKTNTYIWKSDTIINKLKQINQ